MRGTSSTRRRSSKRKVRILHSGVLFKLKVSLGKVVVDSLPENDDACAELLETLVDYLPKRFPTLFDSIGKTGIHNKITGERFVETGHLTGVDALLVVSRLVQDDFLMGKEREDGHVYFSGGLVAFPGFYTLAQYIGQPLEQVRFLRLQQRSLTRFPRSTNTYPTLMKRYS